MNLAPDRGSTSLDSDLAGEAERIAVLYAPRSLRSGYRSLLWLDALLARIALTAREPALAQLKLAWWRDACAALGQPASHPVLAALVVTGYDDREALVALVDAWEEVAVGERGLPAAAESLGRRRAGLLARCAGEPEAAACAAARSWTLATLANHAASIEEREEMLRAARAGPLSRLSRPLRPLAVLAGLARRAAGRGGGHLLGDRLSPLVAMRLGIFGR